MSQDDKQVAPWESKHTWVAHDKAKPMTVSEAREELQIGVNVLKLKELEGSEFYILSVKQFKSGFEEQDYALFCECQSKDGSELFATVIGGTQPIQFLQEYIEAGASGKLLVKPVWNASGQYGGYWLLE